MGDSVAASGFCENIEPAAKVALRRTLRAFRFTAVAARQTLVSPDDVLFPDVLVFVQPVS